MPDDLTKTGKQDDIRINIHQPHELRDWAEKLKVTPDEVRQAVQQVGPLLRDVENELRRSNPGQNPEIPR